MAARSLPVPARSWRTRVRSGPRVAQPTSAAAGARRRSRRANSGIRVLQGWRDWTRATRPGARGETRAPTLARDADDDPLRPTRRAARPRHRVDDAVPLLLRPQPFRLDPAGLPA